jgi:transcriptional regulator with XRE-family HTH domain
MGADVVMPPQNGGAEDRSRMANKKQPNPIDVHVGSRVRLRRMMLGMSQEKLGEHLGITFQQIQKYEKGTNRIGASRLQHIARVLSTPVSFFFEDAPGMSPESREAPGMAEAPNTSYVVDFLSSSEGIQLNKAFVRIKDAKLRRRLIDLVRAMAGEDVQS